VGIFVFFNKSSSPNNQVTKIPNIPQPTSTPTPTPTPTPKPLTFAEMNSLYGPCVRLPVLMYHHIQSRDAAKADKQTNLTVYTDVFQAQMQYLKSKNYNTVTVNDLINFFDAGIPIPAKSILLTFDDGYQDFYTDAYPVLSGVGYRATVFLPTGLMQNPGYLTWGEISGMDASVLFANHTWSHKSVVTQDSIMQREISTADTQLSERGLNNPKTFAYPYGPDSVSSEKFLASLGYKAAFTTAPGNILCKKQRFGLPRIRIGNSSLSGYGF
jgi:peptidoglycan/xylan/chitin deacetylase (PgdA/CDA1 family)